ncbi:SDR family oxidoreductase [Henriciella litoralis]|uniref:SDR family oxidoreductase n=1 Tax=Henriciella litoralis TaxID=568102 RepID=UPI00146EA356|nr:SDR family oxidoreductase [Henriciella litoralis]
MTKRLENKIALVTGAAQGIGAAIAHQFEEQGATVWRTDLQHIPGERTRQKDSASEDDWKSLLAEIKETSGGLDILVNNAGIELECPLEEVTLDSWRKVMSVNVDGVFLGCKLATDMLADRKSGLASVINISSVAGIIGFPFQPSYNTSKGAVRHLSKTLAIEWGASKKPIRCNSIHPGCIDTQMLREASVKWQDHGLLPDGDRMAGMSALCPLGMVGAPDDIAHGAVYLASDESRFVTGIELIIDGGFVAQ